MEKKYTMAIVGCGSMGVENFFEKFPFVYSFAEAIFQNPKTQLVALVDTDKSKCSEMIYKLNNCGHTGFAGYETLDSAVEHEKIDIVCCAAGPLMNSEIISKSEQLGIRGIYCEKPLSLSLANADDLSRIEANSKVKIQVNYLRNYDTHHRAVVNYIREGGIGSLLTVRTLYKGGVIAVLPHTSALLNMLFDGALEVSGTYSPLLNTRCPEDPNVDGLIRYRFAPQSREVNVLVMATGRGDIENDTYLYELEFTGTKGRITLLENGWRTRYEVMELSRVFGSIGSLMPYDTARIPLALKADNPREFMLEGLEQLIASIEHSRSTSCSVRCARDAEEVAHALALSAQSKGLSIKLPLTNRESSFADAKAGVKLLRKEAKL